MPLPAVTRINGAELRDLGVAHRDHLTPLAVGTIVEERRIADGRHADGQDEVVNVLSGWRRSWLATVALGALLGSTTGCSGSDDQVPVAEGTADETDTDDGGSPAGGETTDEAATLTRVTVDGLTFQYPIDLFAAAGAAETEGGSSRPSIDVVLTAADRDGPDAMISVSTVRDDRGSFLDAVGAEERTVVVDLEAARAVDQGDTPVAFVNGTGLRRAADEEYWFAGVTNDGAQFVEVRSGIDVANVETGRVIELLDALTESVFVDGSSDALRSDDCVEGIDVTGEVVFDREGIRPGSPVIATWRVRNTGTCTWSSADGWVFSGGDSVTLLETSDVSGVPPGAEVDVSVEFLAPDSAGQYSTQWQFLPAGQFELLGPPVAVFFAVVEA